MSTLIEVQHLKKYFNTPKGQLHAVDDVSFQIQKKKTIGVVGESGCGKSTLGRTLVHLLDSTDGKIFFEGQDVTVMKQKELKAFREKAQIIFQDPYSSLNPRYTIAKTITEPLLHSGKLTKQQVNEKAEQIMDLVGIEKRLRNAYPHELDGGRRQRVGIGRALALEPSFVVCDEPVSALDVSIQAQILNLLMDLQEQKSLTYMFITHDLSVVRHIADTIYVMYLGQIVETCNSKELFRNPQHPYTKALLSAIPSTVVGQKMSRIALHGELTSPIDPKPGCRFVARCPYAGPECSREQQFTRISEDHYVACHRVIGQSEGE